MPSIVWKIREVDEIRKSKTIARRKNAHYSSSRKKLTEFDRRFIPLTGNRQDDHFLGHFSTYLPHHFFPVVPTGSNEDKRGMRETAMRYTYINTYVRTPRVHLNVYTSSPRLSDVALWKWTGKFCIYGDAKFSLEFGLTATSSGTFKF